MSRSNTAVSSYLTENTLELRVLADVTFTNTTMRLWTGVGSLMVGATHYDGVGTLGRVEKVSESGETFSPTLKISLSAVDSASLNEAITEKLFGKSVVLRRAWLRNGTLVDTPEPWYRGRFGETFIHRGDPERGNYIESTLNTAIDYASKPTYYTLEDHWMTYSGDTFFKYLAKIPGQKARWGDRRTGFDNARIDTTATQPAGGGGSRRSGRFPAGRR